MSDYTQGATRDALRRAAEYIAAALRRASPSAESAASWDISDHGEGVDVYSRHKGVIATNDNVRHPLFAGPSNPEGREHWYDTNQNSPGRTDWADRAVDEAFTYAAEALKETWLSDVARNSLWLEEV